jgi:hypothetical protein
MNNNFPQLVMNIVYDYRDAVLDMFIENMSVV